jgi:hypothetical protein
VYFDGTTVRVEKLSSLDEVPKYIEVHSGAHTWVDVRTDDVAGALSRLDLEDPGQGPVVHEVKEPSCTMIAYSHTVRNSRELHRTIIAATEADVLLTVHDSKGDIDSKSILHEYIPSMVDKELTGVPKAILYFREMLLTALLDSQGEEFIATLQETVRELSELNQRLERGEADTQRVQSELFKVHMFIEDEFQTALLSFRDVVGKLRLGAGKNIDLTARQQELDDTLRDVDGAVGIKANVEKTIDLVSSTVHMKLTERSLETQRRLQMAVWLLTHLSVFLIIPNLVLIFWRLTPWIGDHTFEVGGMEVHSFWIGLLVAGVLSVIGLLALNAFLRRYVGRSMREVLAEQDGGKGAT